jgi:predicted secreted Zn-dependent protease
MKRAATIVLATAKPKLIITYVLPKPANVLPASVEANWESFISGVRDHERVHGDYIVEMVKQIEAATVGLTVPGDPNCRKIRDEMTKRLGALSQEQRQRSRDFDQVELSPGGNVHTLILQLVNGG